MPGSGRAWNKARATYRAECARTNAPCWLCRGAKGAINYDAAPRTNATDPTPDTNQEQAAAEHHS